MITPRANIEYFFSERIHFYLCMPNMLWVTISYNNYDFYEHAAINLQLNYAHCKLYNKKVRKTTKKRPFLNLIWFFLRKDKNWSFILLLSFKINEIPARRDCKKHSMKSMNNIESFGQIQKSTSVDLIWENLNIREGNQSPCWHLGPLYSYTSAI